MTLHLLHPALVHFSIAFLVAGAAIESVGTLAARPAASRFGTVLLALGTVSVIVTLATGYLAANTLDIPAAAQATFEAHERNGWIVLALFGLGFFWRALYRGTLPPMQARLHAVYLLLAAAFVLYSGYLGAELVYDHGVGVGVR